jgi:hypothetical protein
MRRREDDRVQRVASATAAGHTGGDTIAIVHAHAAVDVAVTTSVWSMARSGTRPTTAS